MYQPVTCTLNASEKEEGSLDQIDAHKFRFFSKAKTRRRVDRPALSRAFALIREHSRLHEGPVFVYLQEKPSKPELEELRRFPFTSGISLLHLADVTERGYSSFPRETDSPAFSNEQYVCSASGNYSCIRFTKDNSTRPIGYPYAVLNTLRISA